MKIATVKYYVFFLFIGCYSLIYGQEKESDRLKKQQQELQAKIKFNETLLKNTEENKTNAIQSIELINNKIKYRQELINNLLLQQKSLNDEIITLENEIKSLEYQLEQLKASYKQMIVLAYKMRNNTASILFILSSENYNQANRRMEYLEQLTKYRAEQIRQINQIKSELEHKLILLQEKKNEQDLLAKTKTYEKQQYINDLQKQKAYINNLQSKEQELIDELLAQRKKSEEIKKAITKAINKEISTEREKEKTKPKTIEETKETELSNAGFESNKGRLPWPVGKGEITKGYGKQPHPVHAGVYTYNNGVDITTVKGAGVRAVYGGVVSSVIVIPGAGKAIIIAHGNYRTIYSNLQESYVQKGDVVVAKQEIGSLLVSPDGSVSDVHFEIRKITEDGQIVNLNPSYWLFQ